MAPAERAPRLVRTLRAAAGPDGAAHRVLFVHPGAIPAGEYAGLVAALPAEVEAVVVDLEQVPAYFQAALTGGRTDTTLDRIADLAVAAAGTLAPVGSWTLAGWSFGGAVAHAMLDRPGPAGPPDGVVVIDALAPVPEYTADDEAGGDLDPRAVLGWFTTYLAAKRGGTVDVDPALLRGLPFDEGLARVLAAGVAGGALRAGTPAAGLRKAFHAYRDGLVRNNRLVRAYTAVPTPVGLTLLRPERGLVARPGALGWELVTTAPAVHTVPGDHYTCLRAPETAARFAAAARPTLQTTSR